MKLPSFPGIAQPFGVAVLDQIVSFLMIRRSRARG
jgi:hypothetical protein